MRGVLWRRGVSGAGVVERGVFRRAGLAVGVIVLVLLVGCVGGAFGFGGSGVWWGVSQGSWPSVLPEAGRGKIVVSVQNRGFATVDGSKGPVVVRDVLPAGVTATFVESWAGEKPGGNFYRGPLACETPAAGHEVVCRYEGVEENGGERMLPPYESLEVRINVKVAASAVSGEENLVRVSGGGASGETSFERALRYGTAPGFGIDSSELVAEEEGGAAYTHAGGHPFQLTNVLSLNVGVVKADVEEQESAGMIKDLTMQLPAGLIGNPTPVPQCTEAQFTTQPPGGEVPNECAPETAVGVVAATYDAPPSVRFNTQVVPLFNLTPAPGEPARFGFEPVHDVRVYLETAVRTGSDYGVTVHVRNVPQLDSFLVAKTTLWGVPGAAVHDSARGWNCVDDIGVCQKTKESYPPPLLSMPTACLGALTASVQVDSWQQPLPSDPLAAGLAQQMTLPGMDSCNQVPFSPSISVTPTAPDALSPMGLHVDLRLPQPSLADASVPSEAALRDATVALPAGVSVNPGSAAGLGSCSLTQIGYEGRGEEKDRHGSQGELLFDTAAAGCAPDAKVGTVTIHTPVLPAPLEGSVYLATPDPLGVTEAGDNPFQSLISLYIAAEDPASGVRVKLAGKVLVCEAAGELVGGVACGAVGQLISVFENTPQVPFEEMQLHFFEGSRAPLIAPGLCGSYTTTASLTPWSAQPGQAPQAAQSVFQITNGPGGGPCPSPAASFTPTLQLGATSSQAAASSSLISTISHPDSDQPLGAVKLTLPPGLVGSLAQVSLCGEPQASLGTCGPQSLIGHTLTTAGVGVNPLVIEKPGRVYITGPYNGQGACTVGQPGCAPFGLSIAAPAQAGPFDLAKGTPCDCVVVRARVWVDPHTAQLTIETGQLPSVLRGIALHLQHVQVQVDRPNFTRNPTSCTRTQTSGLITSSQGATAAVSAPYQAVNCASLPFKPVFTVTTHAHHTRRYGAYLQVTLKATPGQANIHSVLVKLPKIMPSRQETLKLACPQAQFETNPASCPAGSHIGYATAQTPLLPVPLTGPAIFVSHAGAGFPDLDIILQGYGITMQLTGNTSIRKNITTSNFKTIPDVPVTTFALTLPTGPDSALTATTNLCTQITTKHTTTTTHNRHTTTIIHKRRIIMPTTITAQNGATIHQNTTIHVTGCKPSKQHKHKRPHKHPNRHKQRK